MQKGIRNSIFFLATLLLTGVACFASVSEKGDSLKTSDLRRMGFFDLNAGPDIRYFKGTYATNPSVHFVNSAYVISARMQNSFLGNYIFDNRFKKFRLGDVLAAEFSPGMVYDKPAKSFTPLIAYRFEFGFGSILSLNSKNDIGLTFTLLKFARDRVSPNISASNILVRYRLGRFLAEAGIEARRDRIFGWLNFFKRNNQLPVQYTFTGRYLISNKKNIGFRLEHMCGTIGRNYINDKISLKALWSLKLFYGIYF
jgi:hypothetical protein